MLVAFPGMNADGITLMTSITCVSGCLCPAMAHGHQSIKLGCKKHLAEEVNKNINTNAVAQQLATLQRCHKPSVLGETL